MTNDQLFLIIIALLSVIPSGVVFLVIWTRLMDHNSRINAALGGRDDINRIEQNQKDVLTDLAKIKTDVIGLDESFRNLINKVNSRQRTEQIQAAREKKEITEDKPEFEQTSMFPPVFPLDNQQPPKNEAKKLTLRRKFA